MPLTDIATVTDWPPMGTVPRLTDESTPAPQVRTVPSPATVTALDVSGAMAAATIGAEAVITMEYLRLSEPGR
jgi:hypothetical protein